MEMRVERTEGKTSAASEGRYACRVCSLVPECLAWDLGPADAQRIERLVEQPPLLDEGHHVYRVGDDLEAVYAVRNGAFKCYAFDGDGRERVLGFSLAGELVGLDGVYSQRHGCNVVALTGSTVCALRYGELAELMGTIVGLRRQILRLASNDLGNHHAALNPDLGAEQRVARFILDLARRSRAGNGATDGFDLPMTLDDIANYLRLDAAATERAFSRLAAARMIAFDRRTVQLLSPERLRAVAGHPG